MKNYTINWKDGTSTFYDKKTKKVVTKKTQTNGKNAKNDSGNR